MKQLTKYDVLTAEEAYRLEEQVVFIAAALHAMRRKRVRMGRRNNYWQVAEVFARRHYAAGKLHTF